MSGWKYALTATQFLYFCQEFVLTTLRNGRICLREDRNTVDDQTIVKKVNL